MSSTKEHVKSTFLTEEIVELEKMIAHSEFCATQVSAKSIDWHIDHSLKVIIKISNALKNSDPLTFQWKFNLVRYIVFLTKYIPRGKGKAPKVVLPPNKILKEDLLLQIDKTYQNLNEFENLPANSNFKHPYFGLLNLKMTKKFLKIHTNHHLKIIRDIKAY